MIEQLILLLIVFVPVVGAFLLPALGMLSTKLRNVFALLLVVFPLAGAIFAALPILSGSAPYSLKLDFSLGIPGFHLSFGLLADGLAVFMAIVSTLVGAIIVFYSWGYISHYEKQNEYYLMVVLFIGSMMGIVFSTNLIFLYLFWEISAIACWRLIGFFRKKHHVLRADKAFLVTVFGALVMLIGFIMVYAQTGTFDLTEMKGTLLPNLAVLLILFGIFSKSATLPFHTWLPDAGVAPSPVTSLLHAAVLVKIGVYVFARLFIVNFHADVIWSTIVPVVAAVSALVAAGAALVETDLKRIIAYSTVSQIGFIFLGLATGNRLALAGGLLYILMHGIAKGGLFLCAGIVEQNAKSKNITELGGLAAAMPVTAVTFIICSFSVMGIPPLGGFWSKYMVIGGAVSAGQPWIALVFIAGAILTILYLLRAFTSVFLGQVKIADVREGSPVMLISVVILAALSVLAGIFINFPSDFVNTIISQIGVVQ
jgi:proton-translocating NADH-quinone oxidoreductase chain M